jgi:hypothetical protein
VKRIFFLLLLLPILSNCTQYTAVIGPSITLAQTGSFAQASTALSKSIVINEVKKEYVADSLTAERI